MTRKVNLTDNNNCVIPGPGAEVGMLEMIKIHVLSCANELFNRLLHVVIRDNGEKINICQKKVKKCSILCSINHVGHDLAVTQWPKNYKVI